MMFFLNECGLNAVENGLVTRLYIFASIPVVLGIYFALLRKIDRPRLYTLLGVFIIAAIGWEIWLTYGIAGGLPVDMRRSAAMTCAIPTHLNWILNSLADVMMAWLGLLLVQLAYRKKSSPFERWHWPAFAILLVWLIGQNVYVEAFVYHLQLGSNGDLSWAPMHPLGSWYNPTLFILGGSKVTLQAQMSWMFMTPIVYALAIYFHKRGAAESEG